MSKSSPIWVIPDPDGDDSDEGDREQDNVEAKEETIISHSSVQRLPWECLSTRARMAARCLLSSLSSSRTESWGVVCASEPPESSWGPFMEMALAWEEAGSDTKQTRACLNCNAYLLHYKWKDIKDFRPKLHLCLTHPQDGAIRVKIKAFLGVTSFIRFFLLSFIYLFRAENVTICVKITQKEGCVWSSPAAELWPLPAPETYWLCPMKDRCNCWCGHSAWSFLN